MAELGLAQGPLLGRILDDLLERVIVDPGAQRPPDAAAARPGDAGRRPVIELLLQAEGALSLGLLDRAEIALPAGRDRRPAQLDRRRRAGPGRAGARRRARARSPWRGGRWRSTRRTWPRSGWCSGSRRCWRTAGAGPTDDAERHRRRGRSAARPSLGRRPSATRAGARASPRRRPPPPVPAPRRRRRAAGARSSIASCAAASGPPVGADRVSLAHDPCPRHRRRRLCRLGVRGRVPRGRPRRGRPRRPHDRPPRGRPGRRRLPPRHLRRRRARSPGSSRRSGSRPSSIARRARWSASRSASRPGTSATTSPAACALLDAARAAGVERIVFSSTAAVYGIPDATPIPEDAPLRPINPYGESKRAFESALAWYGRAYGLRSVSLRYFNVAGATEALGEVHEPETHLIPNVLRAADGVAAADHLRRRLPDADGTCIRDYIHVADLAEAHLLALDATAPGDPRTDEPLVCNLGNGGGFSVREVLAAAERGRPDGRSRTPSGRAGRAIRRSSSPRRPGRRGPRLAAGAADPRGDGRVGLGVAPGPPGRLRGLAGEPPTAAPTGPASRQQAVRRRRRREARGREQRTRPRPTPPSRRGPARSARAR